MDLSHMSDADLEKIANGQGVDHDKIVSKMSDEDLQKIVSGEPASSATQAAVLHGINKATGSFDPALQGLGEAAGRVVGVQGAGGPVKDMGLAPGGPTLDWETLRDAYRAARDHERQMLKQTETEHPVASGVGDVVGAVASPLNKVVKGMSLARAGGVLGGVNALGGSEKEDLPGMALDTAKGIGTGMATGKALSLAGPAAKNAIDDVATAPLTQAADQGLAANAIQKIGQAGEKGNEILEKAVPSKLARYALGHKIQGPLDAAENLPKVAQGAASVVSNGLEKANDFLMRSPRLQTLAQNSPKAFSALAGSLANRVGQSTPQSVVQKPNQAPVDDEQAKQAFLSGN